MSSAIDGPVVGGGSSCREEARQGGGEALPAGRPATPPEDIAPRLHPDRPPWRGGGPAWPYYVRWHLERAWAPLLFRDEDRPLSQEPVAPAQRSAGAEHKARPSAGLDSGPVHSFSTLLNELATLTKNRLRLRDGTASFEKLAEPTPLQRQALSLLGLQPAL